MNFEGKCAIKLVHGLLKLEPSRNLRGGEGVTWVNFCWVCVAGLSDPLPHVCKRAIHVLFRSVHLVRETLLNGGF